MNAAQLAKCDRKLMRSHMEHRPGLKMLKNGRNYTLCFSALVNMMISELRTSEFFFDNNDINIKKVPGFNLAELLSFVTTNEPKQIIQPLDKDLIASKRFDTDFKCLFTSQHLQVNPALINRAYVLRKHHRRQCRWLLKRTWSTLRICGTEKKIVNKLLDKVILVILRHHIARNRASKRISTTETRKSPGKKDMNTHARYFCRAEDKKLKKLIQI
ncbi:hypothetical protein F4703DRAFT_1937505 [Phycomyces blakesleeanus]